MKRFLMVTAMGALLVPAANATIIFAYDNLTGPNNLISFDSATPGTVTVIGPSNVAGTLMGGLDFAGVAGGMFAYAQVGAVGLYSVNVGTGAATFIGGGGLVAGESINDISWNPVLGQMIAVGANGVGPANTLYTINLGTGLATSLGSIIGYAGALTVGLASDAAGVNYVHDIVSDQMFSLAGLAATPLGPLGFVTNFSQGMAIDWSAGGVWYHGAIRTVPSNFAELYTINPGSGAGTLVGTIGPGPISVETGDIAITPVPEPASMLILGAGLVALAARRRRRKA